MILSVVLLCGLSGLTQAHESRCYLTAEERLYHDLVDGYADHMLYTRPVARHNEVMNVSVGMSLVNINSFDKSTGVGEFLTWDKYMWTDIRLTWNPDHYDGIETMRVPASKIWGPDIAQYNTLWSHEEDHIGKFMATVSSEGQVHYVPIHIRKVKCSKLDKAIADDEYECKFKIGSWTYNADMLTLKFYGGEAKMDILQFMGEADHIVANAAISKTQNYACCPETYQDFIFTVALKGDAV